MRTFILLTFCALLPRLLCAQGYHSVVKGRIIDKDSHQPLYGVNISVIGSIPPRSTITAIDGYWMLKDVSTGRITLKITYIGYEDQIVNELLIGTGKETFISTELQERVSQMKEVTVEAHKDKSRANNPFATVSALSFSVEETKRYAGTQNDPSRMVQSFAGIVSANDENNAIVVRGNSPRGLLWRMEGIEIPNPNHFAGSEGSTGGGVSILSANILANTDFYTGAFAPEFGNATSGVFDLHLRTGNTDKREYTLQFGLLGLEAALEGPFSKKYKGSYLINYRYSTLTLLALMGLKIGGNQIPKYQDLSFNFTFPTPHLGTFTLFGIGGLSSLGNTATKDTNQWKTYDDRSEESLSQKMGVVGLTHTLLLHDSKTAIHTVLSLSSSDNGYAQDTVNNQYIPSYLENHAFKYLNIRVGSYINRKLDSKNTVRAGIQLHHIGYHLFQDAANDSTRLYTRQINTQGSTYLIEGYYQWKHRFTDHLHIVSGLHFTYGAIVNKVNIEPRLSAEYRLREHMSLTMGIGLHSRMDAISTYTALLPAGSSPDINQNRHLDFSRSLHVVVGYNYSFASDFRLRIEAYYQYLFAIPVGTGSYRYFSAINLNDGFVNIPLQSTGTGYNYGIELTLEKFFSKGYYFLYTLSLFDSKYKATDGLWRNTAYNSNYVMNLLGGKEFIVGKRKINRIGLNAKILWRGGSRDTPIDLPKSIAAQNTIYDNSRTNADRLQDYFRIDFGVSYRRNKKKHAWILAIDVQNIINRLNIAHREYDRNTQSIIYHRNLGIVPILSFKIEF